MTAAEELLLKVVVDHLLHSAQGALGRNLLLVLQENGEDQEGPLVGSVLVVAVAVENEGGAWGQLLEAVDDGHRLVPLEGDLQFAVNVQLHLVAVLAGFARSINVEDGGVVGGGEGGGQAVSQAAHRPLPPDARRQDEADRLCGLGRLQVSEQVDSAPGP